MKKLGTSILITCISNATGKTLSQMFANDVGLHFACCKDILEYNLFDSATMLEKCGIEYLKKREREIVRAITEYENALIYVDYDTYQENEALFKTIHPNIYLHVPKNRVSAKDGLNKIAYEDRDIYLSKQADIKVNVSGSGENDFKKLLSEIGKEL